MNKKISIAIDGPVASGKGTVAAGLAKRLGIPTLNTGAIYRGITVALLNGGVDLTDERAVENALPNINLRGSVTMNGTKVYLNDRDVSNEINDNAVSISVPTVAAYPKLRHYADAKVRELAEQCENGVIMEGRSIGITVLPNADYKFFLTASVEERARRRMADLAGKGQTVTMDEMIAQIRQRDDTDTNRKHDPMQVAPDAIVIDATNTGIEQTIDKMAGYIKIK